MGKTGKTGRSSIREVIAVSGGPDSVYLACRTLEKARSAVLAHVDYGARGKDSDKDRELVERLGAGKGVSVEVRRMAVKKGSSRFENTARIERHRFFVELKARLAAEKILVAHTADDQVETVLMRILEGSGISGLKGIPRKTAHGVERPLLDTWREDILKYLHKHRVPYRVDRSNRDTRFERNWIRHILVPLLEKRYGKSVKRRIFTLGERFREIDEFLEFSARRWMKRNVKELHAGKRRAVPATAVAGGPWRFLRKPYGALPSALRKKILQLLCFERIGTAPNERLLGSMDRLLVSGGASARQNVGRGAVLRTRYGDAIIEVGTQEGRRETEKEGNRTVRAPVLKFEDRGKISPAMLKRMTTGERAAVFDADAFVAPVSVRPLRAGDRIRPFGLDAEKKVKEVLIDRKISREERWGRPVVCDAEGRILWIPGVVRSSHAAVTDATKRTILLRIALPSKA